MQKYPRRTFHPRDNVHRRGNGFLVQRHWLKEVREPRTIIGPRPRWHVKRPRQLVPLQLPEIGFWMSGCIKLVDRNELRVFCDSRRTSKVARISDHQPMKNRIAHGGHFSIAVDQGNGCRLLEDNDVALTDPGIRQNGGVKIVSRCRYREIANLLLQLFGVVDGRPSAVLFVVHGRRGRTRRPVLRVAAKRRASTSSASGAVRRTATASA